MTTCRLGPAPTRRRQAQRGREHVESQPAATQPLLPGGVREATNGPAAIEEEVDPDEAALASFDLWEEGA